MPRVLLWRGMFNVLMSGEVEVTSEAKRQAGAFEQHEEGASLSQSHATVPQEFHVLIHQFTRDDETACVRFADL